MPYCLYRLSYSREAIKAMVAKLTDREAAARKPDRPRRIDGPFPTIADAAAKVRKGSGAT